MAQGRDDYAQLEEGPALSSYCPTVPQGLSVATEVQKRLTLWEKRKALRRLLQRAEEQLLLKRKAGKPAQIQWSV